MNETRLTDEEREVIRAKAWQQGIDSVILYVERIIERRASEARRDGATEATA